MSYLRARDYSVYQGDVDFTREPIEVALIKMTGGDAGMYFDAKANQNYERARAAGKLVGGYHFAGGTDPVLEADYAIRGMSPLAEGDVFILDWEVQHADPVAWVFAYVNEIHTKVGVWPIMYMNGSTWNSYDWSPVTATCGVWVAWWGISPDSSVPIHYSYVIHQYDDNGTVVSNGVRVDEDAVFLTADQWNKYGYHAVTTPQPVPTPVPDPTSVPEPDPVVPIPPPDPAPPVITIPPPVVVPPIVPRPTPSKHWYDFILDFLAWLLT